MWERHYFITSEYLVSCCNDGTQKSASISNWHGSGGGGGPPPLPLLKLVIQRWLPPSATYIFSLCLPPWKFWIILCTEIKVYPPMLCGTTRSIMPCPFTLNNHATSRSTICSDKVKFLYQYKLAAALLQCLKPQIQPGLPICCDHKWLLCYWTGSKKKK